MVGSIPTPTAANPYLHRDVPYRKGRLSPPLFFYHLPDLRKTIRHFAHFPIIGNGLLNTAAAARLLTSI
jgi:hypothetical protein